ncbi:MAG: DUF1186 domain-containing protein [Rhodopila sp.]
MAATATLTVQGILDALDSSSDVLPIDALEQAIARWDEVAPVLVPCIEAYADGRDRSDHAIDLAFYGLYLMAQQRDTRAFRLLCTLLLDAEASENALSDGVTDEVPSMLVRTYDGDPAPLRTLIEAPDANEEGRETAFEVLAWLTAAGRIDRDETARYLHDLFTTLQPQGPSHAWIGWQSAIAHLGLDELESSVAKVFSRGWIDEGFRTFEEFAEDLYEAKDAPRPMASFADRFYLLTKLDDVITVMKSWNTFRLPEEEPTVPPSRPPSLTKTRRWWLPGFLRR